MTDFNEQIHPFKWVVKNQQYSVVLYDVSNYKSDIFKIRADEGFGNNGFCWQMLAIQFLEEQSDTDMEDQINTYANVDMFCAYSDNAKVLKEFILEFKSTCENDKLIADIFSRTDFS